LNTATEWEKTIMSNIRDRVVAVTSRVLRLDPGKIRPEHAFASDLGAESVQSIELIAMFEEEFGIEMEEDAALGVQTVGGAADYIAKTCREQGVKVEG
jgi:acyl carrier protein